jgi:hypothetical protein
MKAKNKPFSAAAWGRRASTSVMFSAHYADGHIEYFVLPNDERLADDAMQTAQERQKTVNSRRAALQLSSAHADRKCS